MKPFDRSWLIEEIARRWGDRAPRHGDPVSYPRDLERRFRSRDGRELLMRPIRPDDVRLMREGFARLSPETVYRRFHGHVRELSEEALRYLTHVDYHSHLALVALDDAANVGVGVARYYRPEGSELAETAVVVADDWQGRGVGAFLLRNLVVAAEQRGIAGFEAYVQPDNEPVVRMIERSGYRLHREGTGEGALHIWFRFDDTLTGVGG